ncbi:MAG: MBL fold metallo-hydrolase [Actinomycetia bacterium]|nr:MBL fold metallo-hydrolase [Actinomycetes bacterium]MCP4226276.1 MBL fold metallo-hydrolase [Actinomycetes bacterium]MCP5030637.1 MBL fold metallo-hydrolase [Actinomycetes bacterium]
MPLGPTWTIGDVTVTSIIELDQHWKFAWLLPDVTEADIDAVDWLRPHFVDEDGRLILRIQALVVESDGQRILVDTCVGNDKPRPTPLFDMLSTTFFDDLIGAGFEPDSIDQVVCTHLHVDHVGWNTTQVDGQWVPTFPRARYLFGRIEYEHWSAVDETAAYGDVMADSVEPIFAAGLAQLVESDHELTSQIKLEPTPGHTPGHHSIRINSGGAEAVITGDMVHHPIQFPRPDLASGADTDSAAAIATRRSSFARWESDEVLVIGTHFAGPGAGRLKGDGDTWRLVF